MALDIKNKGKIFRIHLIIQGPALPTGTPQIAIYGPLYLTDVVSNGAGTGLSSVTGGFESGMVGGSLYISGGYGFTVGKYTISAYTSTNAITIGSSAGASATGGAVWVNNKTIQSATNMIQGADTRFWYYDHLVDKEATAGSYLVVRSAVINGVTQYAEEDFTVATEITDAGSYTQFEVSYE